VLGFFSVGRAPKVIVSDVPKSAQLEHPTDTPNWALLLSFKGRYAGQSHRDERQSASLRG